MKNIKATIITLTLLISLSLHLIGNNSIKNEKEKISQKRMLLNHDETNNICSKATNSFRKKYSLINSDEKEDIKLSDNDKKFIAFLKDDKLSTGSKYLKYLTFRYFIFIIIDLVLIFFWIFFCFCCCNPCCFCRGEQGCCPKVSYSLSILMLVGLISTGIVGLVFGHPLKNNIVETGCSGFKLFDHFKYGLEEDYEDFSNKWIGLNKFYDMLKDSKEIYELTDNYNTDNSECQNPTSSNDECQILTNGNEIIAKMKTNSVEDLKKLEESENTMNKFKDGLDKIEKKYLDDAYLYLDDYLIKYSSLYIPVFVLIMAFGIIGLLFLSAYVYTCECFKCFYIVLWNIESFFIIIFVLLGVFFGLISNLSKNIIAAVDYSIQPKNLEVENPIFFNKEIKDYLNLCFNGDGIIKEISELNPSIYENFKELIDVKDNYVYNPNSDNLKPLFEIINKTDDLFKKYSINDSLSGTMNCTFMKSDIYIFINEINDNLRKTSNNLEIIIYISVFCALISIICGIIVTNRYKKVVEDLNGTKVEIKPSFDTERKIIISEKNK